MFEKQVEDMAEGAQGFRHNENPWPNPTKVACKPGSSLQIVYPVGLCGPCSGAAVFPRLMPRLSATRRWEIPAFRRSDRKVPAAAPRI